MKNRYLSAEKCRVCTRRLSTSLVKYQLFQHTSKCVLVVHVQPWCRLPLNARHIRCCRLCRIVASSSSPFFLSFFLARTQVSILQQPAFCVVRSLIAFRLTSTHKDYCVVGTDAGKVTILEYLPETSEVSALALLIIVYSLSVISYSYKHARLHISSTPSSISQRMAPDATKGRPGLAHGSK